MANSSFIHLDTQLSPSRYRLLVWTSVGIAMAVIIGLLPLPILYKSSLWLLLITCVAVSQLASKQLLAVSSLPVSNKHNKKRLTAGQKNLVNHLDWQIQWVQGYLLTPFGQTTDIYQAKLHAITDMGMAMVVTFAVFEPLQSNLTFVLWQDQFTPDDWRQLKVMAYQ